MPSLALLLTTCKSRLPTATATDTTHTTVTVTLRDTVVLIQPDSATVTALIECDSLNRAILKQVKQQTGLRIYTQVSQQNQNRKDTMGHLRQDDEQGKQLLINIVCKEDSLKRVIQLREKQISTLRATRDTITVEVEKPLSIWNIFVITTGYITLAVLLIAFIAFIARLFIRP